MSPDELIAASQIPNTHHIFFLGCFESRVTILAQQVRALNLADALIEKKIIRENSRVAVIGAGAAGLTFAAAIGIACSEIKEVDLFEQKGELLHIQNPGRDRYVHPHLYDWPATEIGQTEAGLPILNWIAGSARHVAEQIITSFKFLQTFNSNVHVRSPRTVTSVRSQRRSGCKVEVKDATLEGGMYDVVVLAIGFGLEKLISDTSPSYWSPSILASAIPTPAEVQTIFVSGNGDGGLVDFSMAAFDGLTHQEITQFVSEYRDLDEIKRELMRIETEAWATGADVDIFREYDSRIILPKDMYLRIFEKLRKNTIIIFHVRNDCIFRRETSILNRFVAFAIIQASENAEANNIRVIKGKDFVGPVPVSGEVRIAGEVPFTPSYRFLRLGADAVKNLSPFLDLVNQYKVAKAGTSRIYRSATPSLSQSASERFAKFVSPARAQTHNIHQIERAVGGSRLAGEGNVIAEKIEKVAKSMSSIIIDTATMSHTSELTKFNAGLFSQGKMAPTITLQNDPRRHYANYGSAPISFAANGTYATIILNSNPEKLVRDHRSIVPSILRNDEFEIADLFERESDSMLSEEVGNDFLQRILGLIESWEFSAAVKLGEEIEIWLNSKEHLVSSNLKSSLYVALARVEIIRFETDGNATAALNSIKVRSFLNKAKHDEAENH